MAVIAATASSAAVATSLTTTAVSVTTGTANWVLVNIRSSAATINIPTDSAGNTYTLEKNLKAPNVGMSWYKSDNVTGSATLTVKSSFSTSVTGAIILVNVKEQFQSSSPDVIGAGSTGSSTTAATGLTSVFDGDLVLLGVSTPSSSTLTSIAPDASVTTTLSGSGSTFINTGIFSQQQATHAAITMKASLSPTGTWSAVAISIRTQQLPGATPTVHDAATMVFSQAAKGTPTVHDAVAMAYSQTVQRTETLADSVNVVFSQRMVGSGTLNALANVRFSQAAQVVEHIGDAVTMLYSQTASVAPHVAESAAVKFSQTTHSAEGVSEGAHVVFSQLYTTAETLHESAALTFSQTGRGSASVSSSASLRVSGLALGGGRIGTSVGMVVTNPAPTNAGGNGGGSGGVTYDVYPMTIEIANELGIPLSDIGQYSLVYSPLARDWNVIHSLNGEVEITSLADAREAAQTKEPEKVTYELVRTAFGFAYRPKASPSR